MGQKIANAPLGSFTAKTVFTSTGEAIQEVSSSPLVALRVDEVSTSLSYVGTALPGSLTSAAVWRIFKLASTAGASPIITWADGNTDFDNSWDLRASLTYS